MIPTPDGQLVALQDKGKVLQEGDSQVEVKRLSPGEKARRRAIRNLVLFVIGVATLMAIGVWLMRR